MSWEAVVVVVGREHDVDIDGTLKWKLGDLYTFHFALKNL